MDKDLAYGPQSALPLLQPTGNAINFNLFRKKQSDKEQAMILNPKLKSKIVNYSETIY